MSQKQIYIWNIYIFEKDFSKYVSADGGKPAAPQTYCSKSAGKRHHFMNLISPFNGALQTDREQYN